MHEKTSIIDNAKEYYLFLYELNSLEKTLKISKKLSCLIISAKHIEEVSKNYSGYHLMELDLKHNEISLSPFTEKQLDNAENIYRLLEEQNKDNRNYSIALISAGNLTQIRKSYPNYFLDTKDFISKLKEIKRHLSKKYSR